MKYQNVFYHLEYSFEPFNKVELNKKKYKNLKQLWLKSEQRQKTLAQKKIFRFQQKEEAWDALVAYFTWTMNEK